MYKGNNNKYNMIIKRAEIVYVQLEDVKHTTGSEQAGLRPAIVIQNNTGNKYSPTIIVVFLTSSDSKADIPTHVDLNRDRDMELHENVVDIYDNSLVLCEQVRTLDKSRIKRKVGKVNAPAMERINRALSISLGLL